MEKVRPFSSVQVNLPKAISEEIFAWGEINIPDDEIFVDVNNMHYGREDEIHVTILYGIHTESPQLINNLVGHKRPFEIVLGKISVFTNKDAFDVVKIDVISKDLLDLNQKFMEGIPFTNKYTVYHPHVTIAYVCKGKGWKHNNIDVFDNRKVLVDRITFSSRNGVKTILPLTA